MTRREEAERQLLGRTVRALRIERGLSMRELARRIEVSPATLSALEHGQTRTTADRLHDLARELDVSASDLRAGRIPSTPATGPADTTTRSSATPAWRRFRPLPMDDGLRGAIDAFVRYGYHGATMRHIAELAGMSVPALYHHAGGKQNLLVRAFDLTMSDLVWRLDDVARDADRNGATLLERLSLLVEALALFHASRTDLAFIGASEMRSLEPADRRRIARLRTDVQHRIDAEIAAAVRHGDLPEQDDAAAGRAVVSMCVSVCQWFDPDGPLDAATTARQYARFALRLLGAEDADALTAPPSLRPPRDSSR